MEEVVTKPSAELAVGSALGVALATAFIFLVLNLLAGLGDVF